MLQNAYRISKSVTVSDARGQISRLVGLIKKEPLVLTKRGRPEAVLVGVDYWEKLMGTLDRIYQTTFMEPRIMPYTREFTDAEIAQWEKEDPI